ncbi:hypothetical protein GH733_015446 [Mirounga leonina]|nr:hypothetical protein GH733_015446 [Mirounga leonina]
MAGRQKEKVIPDEVHQNQILRELYVKELRTQKLYTQYHVNPERDDRRLNHFRVYNDITLYKAKMWSLGEDDRHK